MLSHELHLEHHQPSVDLSPVGANFAIRNGNSYGGRGGRSPTLGGHSSPSSSSPNPTLYDPLVQVCHQASHTTLCCYHKLNKTY